MGAPDEICVPPNLADREGNKTIGAHQQHGGAGEVAEDVVPDALGDGRQVGIVTARVGVVVPDDGGVLGREVILDEGERELERGEEWQVVLVVGERDGVDDGDDSRGGRGIGEAAEEEAVDGRRRVLQRVQRELDGRRRVLQRVQRELDVRRLGHLVPALHTHRRSALQPLSEEGAEICFEGRDQTGTTVCELSIAPRWKIAGQKEQMGKKIRFICFK
jgi:hypothetical protein